MSSGELRIRHNPSNGIVAQYNQETKEWSIVVEGQWVRIDHLIESLIDMRTILDKEFKILGGVR